MPRFSGWPDPVSDEFRRLIAEAPSATRSRPVVTLDFDNTCIVGDTGEVVHYELCDQLAYALDDEAFWSVIAVEDGRDTLRAQWEALAPHVGDESDALGAEIRAFSTDLIATYARRYRRLGAASAYEWAVLMHAGLSPDWLRRFSRMIFERELHRPLEVDHRTSSDGIPLPMARGIRIRPAFRDLVKAFEEGGFEVWVVSATNVWSVEAVAPYLGVSPRRVLGQSCAVRDELILPERDGPTTWRVGKVEAIERAIGRRPHLAIGDAWTDAEMLAHSQGLSVLIDKGDEALRAHAEAQGWAIIPADAFAVTNTLTPAL